MKKIAEDSVLDGDQQFTKQTQSHTDGRRTSRQQAKPAGPSSNKSNNEPRIAKRRPQAAREL